MRVAEFPYGRTALVTGGGSGIGQATARLLAQRGFTVYAASRSAVGPVETMESGGSLHPIVMDVTSQISVEQALESIGPKIGVVVHSAGVGIAGAAADTDEAAIRRQFETNYFGVLRVNSALLPQMIGAKTGLVIMISSLAGLFPVPFQSHYCSSKAALEAYGRALRMELKPYGVRVALIQPGDTKTGFTEHRTYDIDPSSVFYETCRRAVGKMEQDEINGRSAESVAKRIVKLTMTPNPSVRNIVGGEYKALALLSRILPVGLVDRILEKMYIR